MLWRTLVIGTILLTTACVHQPIKKSHSIKGKLVKVKAYTISQEQITFTIEALDCEDPQHYKMRIKYQLKQTKEIKHIALVKKQRVLCRGVKTTREIEFLRSDYGIESNDFIIIENSWFSF
ncbi:MAG: hypothetical protein AAGB12_00160 [Pseudomonadota bacterium]